MPTTRARDKTSKLPKNWELGLSVLEYHAAEHGAFTRVEIGCACGVTEVAVERLERLALKKLRNRFLFQNRCEALSLREEIGKR